MSTYNEIIKSSTPTLVDFHAEWCGPCKMMAPILKDLKRAMGEKVKVLKVDVDKNQALAGKLNVRGVPTLILYKEGKQVWRQSGVVQLNQLKSVVESYI